MGLAGFATLSLPGVLRLRAASPAQTGAEKTAVIMVWKPGGCSHIDTYDPKPNAAAEYRGPLSTIPTKVAGLHFTETTSTAGEDRRQADRPCGRCVMAVPAILPARCGCCPETRTHVDKTKPKLPDWMSVTNYLRSQAEQRTNPLPAYVAVNAPTSYNGPAYLGDAYSPFFGDRRSQ